jgi:hypothetical protein
LPTSGSCYEVNLPSASAVALTDYVRTISGVGGVATSTITPLSNFQSSITQLTNLNLLQQPYTQFRTSSNFSKTSDTILASVPGLSCPVTAGHSYRITARLNISTASTPGAKVAISGTCTASYFWAWGLMFGAANYVGGGLSNALGSVVVDLAGSGSTYIIEISGFISVSASGNLVISFAQHTSNGSAATVLIGSNLIIEDLL